MKYQIAEYTIDTAQYRITSGDTVVPAEPKVFDLLVYLIRHRDRVLSREELFREVWEGREVSDATLSNHVKSARKILGDSGELQQTILTIRGRGYQFVAPVVVIPEDAATATDPARKPAAPAWRIPLAIAAVVLVAGIFAWRSFTASQERPGPASPYVVVVPFDVSADAPEAWRPFADQVTREVIRNLRKISGLRVVPPTSAFAFRGNKAREHIRSQLPDVQYVLDGVVSISAGNELRITAELEDIDKGLVVWDKDYEGRTDDTNLFAMQSDIAAAVSESLKVAIHSDERHALDEFPTTNLKAYEAYVAGRYQLDLLSHESLPRAIELFDRAIALDPKFFDAYIARSDAYRQLFGYFDAPINMLQKVVDSLSEAQQLRPDSAEAWSSLGLTYVMAWRWKDAWIALNKAKQRDPTLAQTELGFALYYCGLGEPEKVKRALADADRLDPLNAEMADWGNWALFMVGESDAARQWVDRKMQQHPDIGILFSGAGVGAYIAGDFERSVKLAERGAEIDGSPVALIMLAQAYGFAGQKEKVLPLLEQAASAGTYICPYESAAAYISIGDTERAITLLDDAVAARSNCLMFLRNDPRLEPLRQHPHFPVLLHRVGLDDEAVASYKK
ncbi:MAG TPA: winged helix-turn-helix domain-containing protein [Steroidobacteraceae bacterium]|nr:winged helix-turn-helix domain-containing protein [Steroidobacteraceae bacterium]